MTTTDPWNATDTLDDTTLAVMAERLEFRAQSRPYIEMMDGYLDAMTIDAAREVLDLGCGTGVAARRICQRAGFAGRCHGIDLSGYLIKAATGLAEKEGLAGRTLFETGDTNSLAIADGMYDAVIAHTLFSHVSDPSTVLAETIRVTRPGGQIAIFDGDYASLTFELADAARSKLYSEKFISAVAAQPRVLRQMPQMASAYGLTINAVLPSILTEAGTADFWKSAVESFRRLGPKSGVVSEDEANDWADEQIRASQDGVFFGSSNYYAYIFEKA